MVVVIVDGLSKEGIITRGNGVNRVNGVIRRVVTGPSLQGRKRSRGVLEIRAIPIIVFS